MAEQRRARDASKSASNVCVTFMGLLPDEELIELLRRQAERRGHSQVTARIRRTAGGTYDVRVHHGAHSDAYQHARASLALQGAYTRLDTRLAAGLAAQELPC